MSNGPVWCVPTFTQMVFVPDILLQNNPDDATVRTKHWRSSDPPHSHESHGSHQDVTTYDYQKHFLPPLHAAKRRVHETALRKTRQRHSNPQSVGPGGYTSTTSTRSTSPRTNIPVIGLITRPTPAQFTASQDRERVRTLC
ncbi:hypothetical protein EDB83DRAFT_2522887 [Lactarius deliciosus]|nr:hypothetical protein EDB83DRAFT_2522887 [Lactarius deliciosus]